MTGDWKQVYSDKEILKGVTGVRGADLVTAFEEDEAAVSPCA